MKLGFSVGTDKVLEDGYSISSRLSFEKAVQRMQRPAAGCMQLYKNSCNHTLVRVVVFVEIQIKQHATGSEGLSAVFIRGLKMNEQRGISSSSTHTLHPCLGSVLNGILPFTSVGVLGTPS